MRAALLNENGNIMEKVRERVDKSSSTAIGLQMIKLVRFLCQKQRSVVETVKGIGIASAGPLIQEKGILTKPTNLPFDHVSLTKPITEELNISACLLNDCVAQLLVR